jgi:hypothetical protein
MWWGTLIHDDDEDEEEVEDLESRLQGVDLGSYLVRGHTHVTLIKRRKRGNNSSQNC